MGFMMIIITYLVYLALIERISNDVTKTKK